MEGDLSDIRVHNSRQAGELARRIGGEISDVSGDRSRLPLAVSRTASSGNEEQALMRAEDSTQEASAQMETAQNSPQVEPEKIADLVYRLMVKDMVLERERRP